jgi:hypothetical protein
MFSAGVKIFSVYPLSYCLYTICPVNKLREKQHIPLLDIIMKGEWNENIKLRGIYSVLKDSRQYKITTPVAELLIEA